MSTVSAFTSILVGTDGSVTASSAVDHGIRIARDRGAKLVVVSAFQPVADDRAVAQKLDADETYWIINPREEALSVLADVTEKARAAGVSDVLTFARQGDPADAIIDVAEEQGCDLIVVGHKGMTGAQRFLLGSVPNKVSHHAPCSVLIIRTS